MLTTPTAYPYGPPESPATHTTTKTQKCGTEIILARRSSISKFTAQFHECSFSPKKNLKTNLRGTAPPLATTITAVSQGRRTPETRSCTVLSSGRIRSPVLKRPALSPTIYIKNKKILALLRGKAPPARNHGARWRTDPQRVRAPLRGEHAISFTDEAFPYSFTRPSPIMLTTPTAYPYGTPDSLATHTTTKTQKCGTEIILARSRISKFTVLAPKKHLKTNLRGTAPPLAATITAEEAFHDMTTPYLLPSPHPLLKKRTSLPRLDYTTLPPPAADSLSRT